MYRSGSVIGQTLFSFLIPLGVIWFFLSLLGRYLPPHGLLFMFAILTGVIGSTMYTWVTMFDTFGPYACLPVAVSTLIESKITAFPCCSSCRQYLLRSLLSFPENCCTWFLP